MRRILVSIVPLMLAIVGCRGGEVVTDPVDDGAQQPVTQSAVPAGAHVDVRLDQRISTDNQVGDTFTATVRDPVTTPQGEVVIPRGAEVRGAITGVDESERVGDQAAIRVDFTSLQVGGDYHGLDAEVVEADVQTEREDDVVGEETAVGAAAGAALGTILGGDLLDALIGGALGAGAGTAISLGTGEVNAVLPSGTAMTLQTQDRIALT